MRFENFGLVDNLVGLFAFLLLYVAWLPSYMYDLLVTNPRWLALYAKAIIEEGCA